MIQVVQNGGGLRSYLDNKGIDFNFLYTEDSAFDVAGGKKKGFSYMDNLDIQMTLDTQKMKLWHGGTFFVYGVVNGGSSGLSQKYSGDIQIASNIQAPRTTRLMDLWYQQTLLNDDLSVLIGVHNLDSEFDLSTYGKLFLNSSYGTEPTLSFNVNAPVFPFAAPAIRVSYKFNDSWTLLAAVFDGNAGLMNDPYGTDFSFNNKRGVLDITEADYSTKIKDYRGGDALLGDIKLGSWYDAHEMDDVSSFQGDGSAVRHGGDWGIYGVIDQMVFRQKDQQGLGVFLQESGTPSDRNTISNYTGFGVNYVGLLPYRPADTFGVAYNIADFSQKYIDNSLAAGTNEGLEGAERDLEITYLIQMTKTITFQPDLQLITNPSGNPTIKDATVVMLRGSVSF